MKGLKKIEFSQEKVQEIIQDYINQELLAEGVSTRAVVESVDVVFGVYVVNLKQIPDPNTPRNLDELRAHCQSRQMEKHE